MYYNDTRSTIGELKGLLSLAGSEYTKMQISTLNLANFLEYCHAAILGRTTKPLTADLSPNYHSENARVNLSSAH